MSVDIAELIERLAQQVCSRCAGDGKAHGSDRPFDLMGPGVCPVCGGAGDAATAQLFHRLRAESAERECDEARAELAAERAGALHLRARLGAQDRETFSAAVERAIRERNEARALLARCAWWVLHDPGVVDGLKRDLRAAGYSHLDPRASVEVPP